MRRFMYGFACVATFLAVMLIGAGCTPAKKDKDAPKGQGSKDKGADKKGADHAHKHEHPDEGPHGGALAEWGEEEYHAEFTVDHDKKQATVYILDGSAKKAAPVATETVTLSIANVKPPVTITLKADPEKTDPKGSSSRFVGTHEALGQKMEFRGEISAKVGETPFTGSFEEKAHDHKEKEKKKT